MAVGPSHPRAPTRLGPSQRRSPKKRRVETPQEAGASTASTASTGKDKRGDEYSGVKGDLQHQDPPPKEADWTHMTPLQDVHWSTSEDVQTTYAIGQDVMIVPNTKDIRHNKKNAPADLTWEELWYGRILELRSRDNSSTGEPDVWAKIAWYYSPSWFMEVKVKNTRLKDFGRFELIYTPNHTDIVHADTLNGVEHIYKYDEENYDGEDIPNDSFYTRSTYDTTAKKWIDPPPRRHCTCKESFKVNDKEKHIMHYCPRPACNRWFHESCMRNGKKYVVKDDVDFFEKSWEIAFDEDKFEKIVEEVASLPRKSGVYMGKYAEISPLVLQYARQPIVKGGNYRAYGNMSAVLRARWIVHQAVRRGKWMPDECDNYVKNRPKASHTNEEESAVEPMVDDEESEEEESVAAGKKRKETSHRCDKSAGSTPRTKTRQEPRVSGARFEHVRKDRRYLAFNCPLCGKVI